MLLGFIESKSRNPIWTHCKEKGKRIFSNSNLGRTSSTCQFNLPLKSALPQKDTSIRTHLDNINKGDLTSFGHTIHMNGSKIS